MTPDELADEIAALPVVRTGDYDSTADHVIIAVSPECRDRIVSRLRAAPAASAGDAELAARFRRAATGTDFTISHDDLLLAATRLTALRAAPAASVEDAIAEKDEAYRQRNYLVAALARLFPSGTRSTNIDGWLPEWHGCVYIDLPSGQISYHYHDSHAHLFADLPAYQKEWDGHDKETVHARLTALGPCPSQDVMREALERIRDTCGNGRLRDCVYIARAALASAQSVPQDAMREALERAHIRACNSIDMERMREALSWALDVIDINDARIKELDPEGWEKLNRWADLVAKAKAREALAYAPFGGARFDFHSHLMRQREWSGRIFGPGDRAKGIVDHIRKELCEIEDAPGDLSEWIDVVILALDGAWRSGATPEQIIGALTAKQAKNEARVWPDWRTMPADKAIEHERPSGGAASERERARLPPRHTRQGGRG